MKKQSALLGRVARFILFVFFGSLIMFSAIPWSDAGRTIGESILSLHFMQLLTTIPLIGWLVKIAFIWLPGLLVLIFWAAINVFEVMPIVLKQAGIRDRRELNAYAAIAYVAEVCANLWHYAPYGDGWNDFIRDTGAWDPSLFNWVAIFKMMGSIFVVELIVLFCIGVMGLNAEKLASIFPGSAKAAKTGDAGREAGGGSWGDR